MRTYFFAGLFGMALILGAASPGGAQESNFQPSGDAVVPIAGWSFTPSMTYAGSWDDNVLVHGQGDATLGDYTSLVNPRGDLLYQGHRGEFAADYSGAFILYRQLTSLDSYDQRASVSGRRFLSRHVAIFGHNSFAAVPTTEFMTFVGVPFLRTGSRLEEARGGVEAQFTKRTSAVVSYGLQWVNFDPDPMLHIALLGGHSQGGTFSLKHVLTDHTALTGDYDVQHATVIGNGTFTIQNAWAGAERTMSESFRMFGALGFARLNATEVDLARTGPAWRAGVTRQFRRASLDVAYSRSFVPSFSFGGTQQNEELRSRVQLPVGRRVSTQSGVSWRRNEPLTPGQPRLKSFWIEASIGYAVQRWMRIEGFYDGTYQAIDRPGGRLNRNRVGFQVITATPVRIR